MRIKEADREIELSGSGFDVPVVGNDGSTWLGEDCTAGGRFGGAVAVLGCVVFILPGREYLTSSLQPSEVLTCFLLLPLCAVTRLRCGSF